MGRKLVFDLETKKIFDQVGGQQNAHLLGVSVCGVYDFSTGKLEAFREEELPAMEKLFAEAELLIGFNSKHFDNKVLQPYFKQVDLSKIPHLDMLEEVEKVLGHRVKLESIAQSTLGEGKSGTGLDAVVYYNEGRWEELIKYCLDDVRVTKDVYEYGLRHGYIWYSSGGSLEKIKVPWVERPTILEILAKALRDHQQLEIVYLKNNGVGVQREKRVIDLRAMDYEKIRAFCHTAQAERIFSIAKIFDAKIVGEMDSFQPSLI